MKNFATWALLATCAGCYAGYENAPNGASQPLDEAHTDTVPTEGTTTGGGLPAGGTSTGGTSTGGGSTGTTTGSTPVPLLASIDFEDGMYHNWEVVNGLDQVETNASSPNSSWGMVGASVTQPAHGAKSFQVKAGGDYVDGVLLRNTSLFPISGNQFYVRYYIKFVCALPDSHNTFGIVAGTGGGASGSNLTEVRIGGQFGQLMLNLETNDATRASGDSTGNGYKLTPGQWYCIENAYDGATPSMRTWVNNTEIPLLDVLKIGDWSSTPNTTQWMPSLTEFKVGWQSYHQAGAELFLDDVAIAKQRIGCL